ncbi:tellurite resistance methyltransferase TehB [Oceanisphaera avium]|uniref:Tellurite resistance methyltransferase TehB n=1 Tax=Oceanisphaera avium TaxID=1903694 RepID=A0A1Y0CW08_9GAMM|nr:tellurite resistance methyltransferase TehB [Oceanisphaera avium]ART79419.1 tellurite resistance methyltransferase TehB [Oceanisphaera avium]
MTIDLNSRYGLNAAHSEVKAACNIITPCKVLDMGCSNGRNALFLSQQGFEVTAVDNNANAIDMLQRIINDEGLNNINAKVYDINQAQLSESYGFISCTVTLMFLKPSVVDKVIKDMQAHTAPNGYNLIVCAMSTDQYPCPMPFSFTFDTGELKNAYQGWELIKYNEELGTMHNGAQLQFATLLAKKIA